MVAVFYYNGVDLGADVVRLGALDGLTTKADQGTIGTSSIPFDDPTGTLVLDPHRAFQMNETDCAAIRCYGGYSTQRDYARADSLRTGAASRVVVSMVDLNAIFSFKVINHTTFHYNRPAETDIERITWLRSVSANVLGADDNGLIDTANPVDLSPVDYTGQFPLQVLNDCADRSGKNFFAYADPTTGATSLAYFKSTDTSFYVSTLAISNVLADLDSTTFAPIDATLSKDPSQVYDGVLLQYSGGEVYERATGRILPRDTVAPSSNTSSRLAATHLAQKVLAASALETETVTCTIALPPSQVNLLMAGMLVNATFTQFPGWESGLDVRVLERTIKQDEETQAFYNVTVVLGHPLIVNFISGPNADNSRVWPSDLPPKPGITDSFDRADDSVLGTADCGRVWVNDGGTGAIVSDQGVFTDAFGNQKHLPGPWPVPFAMTLDVVDNNGGQVNILVYGHAGATAENFQFLYRDTASGGPDLTVQALDGSSTAYTNVALGADVALPFTLDFSVDSSGVHGTVGSTSADALFSAATPGTITPPDQMDGNLEFTFGTNPATVDNLDVEGVPGIVAVGNTQAQILTRSLGS